MNKNNKQAYTSGRKLDFFKIFFWVGFLCLLSVVWGPWKSRSFIRLMFSSALVLFHSFTHLLIHFCVLINNRECISVCSMMKYNLNMSLIFVCQCLFLLYAIIIIIHTQTHQCFFTDTQIVNRRFTHFFCLHLIFHCEQHRARAHKSELFSKLYSLQNSISFIHVSVESVINWAHIDSFSD